jgi:hypothetical protein
MTSEVQRPNKDKYLPTNLPEVNFALLLSGVIESIKADPAQLRNAIYELARVQLQREVWHRNPPMNILEMRRLMLALETAVEHVETVSSQEDELQARHTPPPPRGGEREPFLIMDHASIYRIDPSALPSSTTNGPLNRTRKSIFSSAGPVLRGSIVAILALALLGILDRQFDLLRHRGPPVTTASTTKGPPPVIPAQLPAVSPPSAGFPLPSVYGVYAVSSGQLSELEPLVGRVPDQKVFMSTPVKTPSHAILPDGRIMFIVYRRDIATNAPDRVAVRVIAKVMRAMTFNTAGKSNTMALQDQWTIRGNSYEFRVAPLSENPEMLLIRPENSDFAFPAGRYGLVLKGLAYDFTVAGPITEAAQCLERTEAANGSFYSECRNP